MASTPSGKVTSSQGGTVLTYLDTGSYGTVSSRTLVIYDSNGVPVATFNMGASLSQTYNITADSYFSFVCTVADNVSGSPWIATVNYLAENICITTMVNAVSQLGCGCDCGSEKLTYIDISNIFRFCAESTALFGLGVSAQSLITAANTYISGI